MPRLLIAFLSAVLALVLLGLSSIFIVDERDQALVLQFGQVKQIRTDPGLYFKLPIIQEVVYYDGRILPLDTQALEVTPLDERRLVVDAFARWRIIDPVEFRQAVGSEVAGAQRLGGVLNASLREVLGSVSSDTVLSPERADLMRRIGDTMRSETTGLGVEIIDVRIRRADLPEQNLKATFDRMKAERQREAADERARGKERAQEIRATADRQAVELSSDARRQSAIIRGQADAERNTIYAAAFGRNPEFFAFYRSLEAYKKALTGANSTLVITPDSAFFDYLESPLPDADAVMALPTPDASVPTPDAADGSAGDAAPADQSDQASDAAGAEEQATGTSADEAPTGATTEEPGAQSAGQEPAPATSDDADEGQASPEDAAGESGAAAPTGGDAAQAGDDASSATSTGADVSGEAAPSTAEPVTTGAAGEAADGAAEADAPSAR